jgi:hypothetical protein
MSGGKVAPSDLYRRHIIHVRNHTRDLLGPTAKPRRSKGSKLDAEDAPISRPIHRKRSFTPG